MTAQDHHDEQDSVRERLGGVVHVVQEAVAERVTPVSDRVAPAVDAVTNVFHEAGHAAAHLGRRLRDPAPETGPALAPSDTQIVRPTKGSATFHAWRDGHWTPVHREHGAGWVWSA